MEEGFLYLDYSRTSWLRERPRHFWQGDFSDRLGPKNHAGIVNYPALSCRTCRVVVFEYPSA